MTQKSGSGCLKSCAIGCASAFVLALVLAIGLWLGRDSLGKLPWFEKISETVETAKSEAVEMNALGARLATRYPAEAIPIRAHIQSENGRTVKTLVVAFVNPEFPVPESASGREETAREIARAIAADYATLGRYDQLRLSFVVRGAGGTSLGSTSEFQFPTAELLHRPPSAP
ncbi:MAG: hypothetical protein ACREI7_01470 [Myxococcota bacterium]